MSQKKDSKPRKKVIGGYGYIHAGYLADILCDAETPADLREAAAFGINELCTLLGIEQPQPAPDRKAWEAVKQLYVEARRMIEDVKAEEPKQWHLSRLHAELKAAGLPLREYIDHEREAEHLWLATIPGLAFQVAEELSELLHHLWCKNSYGEDYGDSPSSMINLNERRAPQYILRNLKRLRRTRLAIEEFGQARVSEAVKERDELYDRAQQEITRQIVHRDLRDFITSSHFRIVLTPTIGKR